MESKEVGREGVPRRRVTEWNLGLQPRGVVGDDLEEEGRLRVLNTEKCQRTDDRSLVKCLELGNVWEHELS